MSKHEHKVGQAVRMAVGMGLLMGGSMVAVAAENDGLEEVVVTAQFREQSLQSTPLSITAVNAAMLEARNQTNIAEVASQAPNVTLKAQGSAFGPSMGASIRGVGQFDFNPALEPGVGLYVDDVYFATLTGSLLDLLDLDRVEILRGPQGTLAGRNSIGGAIKLYSKKPGADGGSISATYGSRNRLDFRGSYDFELSDRLFARVSGVSKRQGGHVQVRDYGCEKPTSGLPIMSRVGGDCVVGEMGDVNYDAVRAAVRFAATDNLEINAAVDYTKDTRGPAAQVIVQGSAAVNQNVQPILGVTNLALAAFVPPKGSFYNYATYYNPPGTFRAASGATTPMLEGRPRIGVDFEGWGGSASIDWKISDTLAVKSISAYREYDSYFSNDNDLSPLANSLGYGDQTFHSFSQELRLNGSMLDNNRLEYTLGAFFMDQKSVYATTQDLRYSPSSLTQFVGNDPVNADTTAFFGHLSYAATDALTVTAGLRYTDEHKDYTFSRRTYAGALHPSLGALDGKKTDYDGNKLDYRLNVQYQWTDGIMTYAQYATGFKGGGVSPRPFGPAQAAPFNPEELTSYEVGIKSDLFDRALRLNASVFQSNYNDMLLSLSTCPAAFPPVSPCALLTNAGDAEMKGVEVEATWRPVDGLSVDASFSKLDFEYKKFNPAAGGPTNPRGPQFGMRPAYVPETKWSIGAQYQFAMGERGSLTPRVDFSHQGDLYTNGFNAATNLIESYTVGNARLSWRNADEDLDVSLEVTNLTDKYYFITRFDQFTLTGVTDGQVARPREYALTVKRKF
jgi:iron complex outermembrane recepter protein